MSSMFDDSSQTLKVALLTTTVAAGVASLAWVFFASRKEPTAPAPWQRAGAGRLSDKSCYPVKYTKRRT